VELLNAAPAVIAEAVGAKLITGVPLAMVKVAAWMLVPAALVAVSTAFVKIPAAVGVPLITPFVATESPPGRFVPEKAIGAEPVAVMVLLNSTPTVPE
jgi:hypothetical protein